jgi:poly-gamma-glutamate capsule biosynthesis protein CapA/YwtB (metallophosphatase superfamily)
MVIRRLGRPAGGVKSGVVGGPVAGPGPAAWDSEKVGDCLVTLFLCGDVMPGRGVDQILPHPGDPELQEAHARDARVYVGLAERAHGPIPRPVSLSWPWGDALGMLEDIAPDVRVINLETSITTGGEFAPGKAVHYRMSPANVGCVAAARPDTCALANNHVLDFGHRGLADTVQALAGAGLRAVGAGPDSEAARRPATVLVRGGRRAVIASCGTASAGIPPGWAAAPGRPGVNRLPDLSSATADDVIGQIHADRRPGDIAIVSIHWGSNWGYYVRPDQVRFAHRLVDGGVDLVHGHSSHHPRPIEVFRGKLILYGCGDCIDDYEGIRGHQAYRPDLRLLYFAALEADTGQLTALQIAPMQARRMRLHHAPAADRQWLTTVLDRISQGFGSRVDLRPDGMLALAPGAPGAARPAPAR